LRKGKLTVGLGGVKTGIRDWRLEIRPPDTTPSSPPPAFGLVPLGKGDKRKKKKRGGFAKALWGG